MVVKLKYEYSCCLCPAGNKHVEEHMVRLHGEIPRPCLPSGWHTIDNNIVCDKHGVNLMEVIRIIERDAKWAKEREDANASASKESTVQTEKESQGESKEVDREAIEKSWQSWD